MDTNGLGDPDDDERFKRETGEIGRGGDVGGDGREEREESLCFNAERNGTGLETDWFGARHGGESDMVFRLWVGWWRRKSLTQTTNFPRPANLHHIETHAANVFDCRLYKGNAIREHWRKIFMWQESRDEGDDVDGVHWEYEMEGVRPKKEGSRRWDGHPGLTLQAEDATAFRRGRFVSLVVVATVFKE